MRWTEAQFQALTGTHAPPPRSRLLIMPDAYKSNVRGWRIIGDSRYYFKSLWEINYAHYLEFLKQGNHIKSWDYEPETFKFPKDSYKAGPFYYKPDFKVVENNGTKVWYEVKGWMNPSSKKKIKRFQTHFPAEGKLIIIGEKWFKQARKNNLHKIVPGWEFLPKTRKK